MKLLKWVIYTHDYKAECEDAYAEIYRQRAIINQFQISKQGMIDNIKQLQADKQALIDELNGYRSGYSDLMTQEPFDK